MSAETAKESAELFPARAGVIPKPRNNQPHGYPIPRTRGGDPSNISGGLSSASYSPHARG